MMALARPCRAHADAHGPSGAPPLFDPDGPSRDRRLPTRPRSGAWRGADVTQARVIAPRVGTVGRSRVVSNGAVHGRRVPRFLAGGNSVRLGRLALATKPMVSTRICGDSL